MAHIHLDKCSLSLPVYGTGNRSLKQIVMSAMTRGRVAGDSRQLTVVDALKSVDLAIEAGDRVGLVGHNGAGKTTLLRLLGGVYEPTGGRISVNGTVTSLIDVTLGMDMDSTGYENIVLRGMMLGMSKAEARTHTPDIAAFSGLGDYLAMPVRTYSSGMVLRLAFSIATTVHPDILLMDEWLSVGDAEFVQRAEERLKAMVDKASILVIASHNPTIINDLCNVIVRLEKGRIVEMTRL